MMSFEKVEQLTSLLAEYMNELQVLNERNERAVNAGNMGAYVIGVKAQYEHARCIQRKLAKRVNEHIKAL